MFEHVLARFEKHARQQGLASNKLMPHDESTFVQIKDMCHMDFYRTYLTYIGRLMGVGYKSFISWSVAFTSP